MMKAVVLSAVLASVAFAANETNDTDDTVYNNYYIGPWGSELMAFAPNVMCQPISISAAYFRNYICINDSAIEIVIFSGSTCTDAGLQCACKHCDYSNDDVTDPCDILVHDDDYEYPLIAEAGDFRCDGVDDYAVIEASTSEGCGASVPLACTRDTCFKSGFDVDDVAFPYTHLGYMTVQCNSTMASMRYYFDVYDAYGVGCVDALGAPPIAAGYECVTLVDDYKGQPGNDIYAETMYCGSDYGSVTTPSPTDSASSLSMSIAVVSVISALLLH